MASETWADAQFDMLEAAYSEVPIEAKARIAELEALAKDLYENAVEFSFNGWIPYYQDRFAALGIEVER